MKTKTSLDEKLHTKLKAEYQTRYEPDRTDLLEAIKTECLSTGTFDASKFDELKKQLFTMLPLEKKIFVEQISKVLENPATTAGEKMEIFVDFLSATTKDNEENLSAFFLLHYFKKQPGLSDFLIDPKSYLQTMHASEIKKHLEAIAKSPVIFSSIKATLALENPSASTEQTSTSKKQEKPSCLYFGKNLYLYDAIAEYKEFPPANGVKLKKPKEFQGTDLIDKFSLVLSLIITKAPGPEVGESTRHLASQLIELKESEIEARTDKTFSITEKKALVEFLTPSTYDPTWSNLTGNAYTSTKASRDMSQGKVYIVSSLPPEEMLKETAIDPKPGSYNFVCFDREDALYLIRNIKIIQLLSSRNGNLNNLCELMPPEALLEIFKDLDVRATDPALQASITTFLEELISNQGTFNLAGQSELNRSFNDVLTLMMDYLDRHPFILRRTEGIHLGFHQLLEQKLSYVEHSPYEKLFVTTLTTMAHASFSKQPEVLKLLFDIEIIDQSKLSDEAKYDRLNDTLQQYYHDCVENDYFAKPFKVGDYNLTEGNIFVTALEEIFVQNNMPIVKNQLQKQENESITKAFRNLSQQIRIQPQEISKKDVLSFIDHIKSKISVFSSFSKKWDLIEALYNGLATDQITKEQALLQAIDVFSTPRNQITKNYDRFEWIRGEERADSVQEILTTLNATDSQIASNLRQFLLNGYSSKKDNSPITANDFEEILDNIRQDVDNSFDTNAASTVNIQRK